MVEEAFCGKPLSRVSLPLDVVPHHSHLSYHVLMIWLTYKQLVTSIDIFDQTDHQESSLPHLQGMKWDRHCLVLHQLIHFWKWDTYALEDFSLHNEHINRKLGSLYCRLRYSTQLAGGVSLALPVNALVGQVVTLSYNPWKVLAHLQ